MYPLIAVTVVGVPKELTSLLFCVKSTKVTRDICRCCRRILACGRVVACNSPCSGVGQHNVCVPCSYSARQLLFHISIHTITVSIDGPYAAYMEKGRRAGGDWLLLFPLQGMQHIQRWPSCVQYKVLFLKLSNFWIALLPQSPFRIR